MEITSRTLQDFLAGRLSEEENLAVQIWLADNMNGADVDTLLSSTFDACRTEAGKDDETMLLATRKSLGIARRRPNRMILFLAAAIIILALCIPAALSLGYRLHKVPAPIAWHEIVVPNAETRNLALPDGTTLTLNAGSRITWPDAFSGDAREIFLDGEVLANVAKDPEKPFIIHSGDVDVRVHGTRFDLKSYREASTVEVMLMEGSVSLDLPGKEGKREVLLAPGDLAQYDRKAGEVSLGSVASESRRTFADGRSFSFINIPLQDIAADLERSFGTKIVVADGRIAFRRFLAFFTNGESLDEILSLLERNGGLRISRSGDTIYIYGKKQ